jgi:hypothetical protein
MVFLLFSVFQNSVSSRYSVSIFKVGIVLSKLRAGMSTRDRNKHVSGE